MREYVVYPRPQWLQAAEGHYTLPSPLTIACRQEALRPLAEQLCGWLLQEQRLSAQLVGPADRAAVTLDLLSDPACQERCTVAGWLTQEQARQQEGYLLHVGPEGIILAGADEAGAFYGVQSLHQLVDTDGSVPYLTIQDWPYKPLRGMHLYLPARQNIPFLKDTIALLAAYKYNTLFLEVGGGVRYERHPEVNAGWEEFCRAVAAHPGGMRGLQHSQPFPKDSCHAELAGGSFLEKDEVREIIAWADQHHIEIIPEVQALSHAYYLLAHHRELAERPDDPWPDTWCPSNPESYALYFDIVEEIIDLFHPRTLHIGHDEWYTIGCCPRCKSKSGARLLAEDLTRLHDFLSARGVRMAMWGDKLMNIITGGRDYGGRMLRWVDMSRGVDHTMVETYHAVDFVPKDILILDWYWALDPTSERYFHEHGFQTIYGNFGNNFEPAAFWQWQQRSPSDQLLGAEIPTWCDTSAWAFGHNGVFFNLLFAANMLWWAHYRDQERTRTLHAVADLQPRLRDKALGCVSPSRAEGSKALTPIPLGPALNGAPPFASCLRSATDIPLPLASSAEGHCAVVVESAQRESGEIIVGQRADSLLFLHSAVPAGSYEPSWGQVDACTPDEADALGYYEITYTDGTAEQVALRYGENIARADMGYGQDIAAVPFWADLFWEGQDEAGRPVSLYRYEWINPHPQKEISRLRVRYTAGEGGQILLFSAAAVALQK